MWNQLCFLTHTYVKITFNIYSILNIAKDGKRLIYVETN